MKRSTITITLLWLTMLMGRLHAAENPNVIIIMVDDMGFSDIGCYGGEIQTPNIDALAAGGIRFSRFYNASRCCPTRASLMTGLHPHLTGIGHMTNSPGTNSQDRGEAFPNYRGFLNRQCATVGELLGAAGYSSYLAGKWHLGEGKRDQWPLQRGFDQFYGCLSGATRFFSPDTDTREGRGITFGNEPVAKVESTTDRPYYTTDAFTDYGIRFIEEGEKDKPFFLYLAYTAPHWPHQAHEEDIDKYRGNYQMGWDALRKSRLNRQIELGLFAPDTKLSPRDAKVPDWDGLTPEKQKEMDLRMAVYAAMIDRIDQNVGKLVGVLKERGLFENTLILFLSDNGACAEGPTLGSGDIFDVEKRNLYTNNNYGAAWANVSSTPFRLYKHYTHEGGAATPFIMHWPKGIQNQPDWYREPAQVIDVVPTILDVCGVTYPESYQGNTLFPLRGMSLRPAFAGGTLARTAPMFSEHENNAFMMDGNWKLVGKGVSLPAGPNIRKWELYNLDEDRTELVNLVNKDPERARQMMAAWNTWSNEDRVYPKPAVKSRRDGGRGKAQ